MDHLAGQVVVAVSAAEAEAAMAAMGVVVAEITVLLQVVLQEMGVQARVVPGQAHRMAAAEAAEAA
jgi:hypothetical protein